MQIHGFARDLLINSLVLFCSDAVHDSEQKAVAGRLETKPNCLKGEHTHTPAKTRLSEEHKTVASSIAVIFEENGAPELASFSSTL